MKISGLAGTVVGAVLLICVAVSAYVLAARSAWLNEDETSVQERYERPNSRFIEVDGVRIHYVDEGSGPAVLLLHGSYLDLGVWDGWADDLSQSRRVVRIDRSTFGLTGRDTKKPGYEREASLITQFADALGLKKMVVVAASSGGTTAARLTALRPDLVSRLVLINFPLSRGDIKPAPLYALSIWMRDKLFVRHQPEWHMRWTLRSNLVDKAKATDQLVERLAAEANRPGILDDRAALEAGAHRYSAENRIRDLAAIKAPTLLIWGEDNPLLTVESGQEAFAKVGAGTKEMAVLPGASHMIPVERSDEALARTKAFLIETGSMTRSFRDGVQSQQTANHTEVPAA